MTGQPIGVVLDASAVIHYATNTESVAVGELVLEMGNEGSVAAIPTYVLVDALYQAATAGFGEEVISRIRLLTAFPQVILIDPVTTLQQAEDLAMLLGVMFGRYDHATATLLTIQHGSVLATASKDPYHSLDGLDVIELDAED